MDRNVPLKSDVPYRKVADPVGGRRPSLEPVIEINPPLIDFFEVFDVGTAPVSLSISKDEIDPIHAIWNWLRPIVSEPAALFAKRLTFARYTNGAVPRASRSARAD